MRSAQAGSKCARVGRRGWELNSARWNAGEAVSGEGLTLSLVWGRLALQLAGLQCPAQLHADDIYLGLTVLQHLLRRQQQLPVLGAAVAIRLDHVLCPLLHLQLDGQLLLQTGYAAQVGG